jgi:hypothetical protein
MGQPRANILPARGSKVHPYSENQGEKRKYEKAKKLGDQMLELKFSWLI